jgi:hypothetical protein
MKKIIILWLILLTSLSTASDIPGDTNNDGVLSGEEQYFLDYPTQQPKPKKQIELITTQPANTQQPAETYSPPSPPTQAIKQSIDSTTIKRDENGRIVRSETAKDDFKSSNPCPSNGHRSGSCPGYVIDHIMPLACGGADDKTNMQWQSKAEGKAKDKWERNGCQVNKTASHKNSTVLYDVFVAVI